MNAPPPASDYLGAHQKQKFSPRFRFGARTDSFNMEGKILFLMFCPQGLGQVAELEFGLGQSKTVICGNGFGLASADYDFACIGSFSRRAGGCGRNARRFLVNYFIFLYRGRALLLPQKALL